jgi:hypothetical protein
MCDIDERWNGPPPRCEGISAVIIIIIFSHLLCHYSRIYESKKQIKGIMKALEFRTVKKEREVF